MPLYVTNPVNADADGAGGATPAPTLERSDAGAGGPASDSEGSLYAHGIKVEEGTFSHRYCHPDAAYSVLNPLLMI